MTAQSSTFDREVESLVATVYSQYHHDFRQYSRVSLRRRMTSAIAQLDYLNIGALHEHVQRDPSAFERLLDYLTVQVSDLFRDPQYFLAVRQHVVPVLKTYPSLKVWVAGCSTGEEAYSLAILFHEEGLLKQTMIYATDINARALAVAEAGVYDINRLATFSTNHQQSGGRSSLSDYYTAAYGNARLHRSLRDRIVFADHSLSTDNVFAEVHFVSCRNVLIYFDADLQERALRLFGEALCRRGFLGIGARESIRFSPAGGQFVEVVRHDRIFRKAV